MQSNNRTYFLSQNIGCFVAQFQSSVLLHKLWSHKFQEDSAVATGKLKTSLLSALAAHMKI